MKGMIGWLALGIAVAGMAGTQSVSAAEAQLMSYGNASLELYRPVLDQYNTALFEQWSMQEYQAAGLCPLFAYFTNPSQVGFWLEDVDYNGTEELLIGEIGDSGEYAGMFFEMYTVIDGAPVLMASSTERSCYYLCTDGNVANEGSGGASQSICAYYMADSDHGVLTLTEAVIYDEAQGEETPWFYSRTGTSVSDCTPIMEEDAAEIMDSHEYEAIEYIPFAEYEV